jgi:transcriptional regulator with XRE-family HTH domain
MTLNEKILSLRTSHKMSQGDLAEKLEVSRQSVSKWETGASIPELDKLIMMSNLFNITLDELVKSDTICDDSTPDNMHLVNDAGASNDSNVTYIINQREPNTRKIIGFILLGTGLLGIILGIIFHEILLILSALTTVYGIIILVAKKHPGLICGWLTTLLLCAPLYMSGARFNIIGSAISGSAMTTAGIVTVLFYVMLIIMIIVTVRCVRMNKCKDKKQSGASPSI